MIGTRAFLMQLLPLLLPIFMLVAVVAVIVRSRRRFSETETVKKPKPRLAAAVAGAIVLLMAANGAYRLLRQVQYHATLENLRADSIRAIKIGTVQLDKSDEVKAVISALNEDRWYEPTAGDGGRAASVEMVIEFQSGDELHFPVSRHKRYDGVIIDFVSQDRNSRFIGHYGCAVAEHLSVVLDQLNVPLPKT